MQAGPANCSFVPSPSRTWKRGFPKCWPSSFAVIPFSVEWSWPVLVTIAAGGWVVGCTGGVEAQAATSNAAKGMKKRIAHLWRRQRRLASLPEPETAARRAETNLPQDKVS